MQPGTSLTSLTHLLWSLAILLVIPVPAPAIPSHVAIAAVTESVMALRVLHHTRAFVNRSV